MEKTIYADKTFSSQEYDTLGRRVAAIDQNGLRTEYRYDDLGRLTGVKNALNQWTEYGYNEQGQLIYQEDARDRRTYYEYDALGRRSATVLPLNQRSGMTYDEVGNLKTMTDYNGHIVTYIYDELNRLSEKQFQDGSKVQYGYTLNGLQDIVTFRNGAGLVTSFYNYDYDVRDRLVKRTDAIGGVERAIAYGYDIASNMTSVTTASGITTYSYDERNRLDLVKQNNILQADYDYDAANRLIKTSFGNNTIETRVYDNLNRLKELTSQRGNVLLSKYVYSLDKVGNRKAATETVNGQGRAIAYTYDDLYRLTDEAIVDGVNGNPTSHYVYDAVGNRDSKTVNGVTTAYAYDANDRLLTEKVGTATTVSYSYDNNGSTLTKVENGVTTTYTWNDEKRMVSATVGSTTTAEYVYNDQGIRVASKVNGVETRYLLDEGITANVWEEYAPNGTVQTSYAYGYDLITQTQANQTNYYLVDGLGSTRLLTDTQGQVLNSYGYEAFGQTVSQSGSATNKYQYAGEQFDATLDDYYLRQRFYDTSSGRFGRMDTYGGKLREPSTLNKYLYTANNPITWIDPSGFVSENNVPRGNFIHNFIGIHFLLGAGIMDLTNRMDENEAFIYGRVYEPRAYMTSVAKTPTVLRIVRTATGMPHHPGIAVHNGDSPDLVDFNSRNFYEIKPQDNQRSINEARAKMEGIIDGMRWIGYGMMMMNIGNGETLTGWSKGQDYVPPPIIPLGSGVFATSRLSEPGIVTYKTYDPRKQIAGVVITSVAMISLILAVQEAAARGSRSGGLAY
jgi:RHS repeat-associated protein